MRQILEQAFKDYLKKIGNSEKADGTRRTQD